MLTPWKENVYRIGIDPSLCNAAVFVLRPDGGAVDWLVVHSEPAKKKKMHYLIKADTTGESNSWQSEGNKWLRTKAVAECVASFIFKYLPAAVCIEDYAFGAGSYGSSSIITLGELGGTLKLYLENFHVSIITPSTQQLRKFLVGSGKASKEEVIAKARDYVSRTQKFKMPHDPFENKKNAEHLAFAYAAAFYLYWKGI